jgi:hypothetical protein
VVLHRLGDSLPRQIGGIPLLPLRRARIVRIDDAERVAEDDDRDGERAVRGSR